MGSAAGGRRFSPHQAFALTRRGWATFALAVLLGVLTAWIGLREVPVPIALEHGNATLPMWRLLAMGVGILPALSLHSNLRDLEETSTERHRRAERRYLLGLSLACAGVYLVIASLTLHLWLLAIVSRSLSGWLGLALMSGRILGWRLAWAFPVAASCILAYWGAAAGTGNNYAWWEFSARPHDDVPSLLLTACLLAGGVLAYSATPWRWKRLTSSPGHPPLGRDAQVTKVTPPGDSNPEPAN